HLVLRFRQYYYVAGIMKMVSSKVITITITFRTQNSITVTITILSLNHIDCNSLAPMYLPLFVLFASSIYSIPLNAPPSSGFEKSCIQSN
uniref:Uncharacterized protein n=1 Tax=Amphimedon queenslandica TaxID=400682 RepID=A0A1X7STR9_AMPQE